MPKPPLENYIRTYRKRLQFSQSDIAFLLGGESGTKVSRYEKGRREPTLKTALALEAALGIPVRDLFAGKFYKVDLVVRDRAWMLTERLKAKTPSKEALAKLERLHALSARELPHQ